MTLQAQSGGSPAAAGEDRDGRMSTLTLWGVGTPRTLRVHWALAELDLPYITRPVEARSNETKSDAFTTLNARQKIPVLQDGDQVITESAAIVIHLSDAYSPCGAGLVPSRGRQRAACLEMCFFALAELDAASLYVIRRHRGLAEIYGEAPSALAAACDYFRSQMRTVEQMLNDGRPFILGAKFTAADIMLCTCLSWALREGIDLSPKIADYAAAVASRPAFQRASICNTPR